MEVITLLQGDEESNLTPLFIVHAVSGLALPFCRLEALSEDSERPIYGITSPMHCAGHDNFKFPSSLQELAAYYIGEVKKIQPEGPYLLGGWSMGGMVAMFMAQLLEARDEEVIKVIMIDSANPEAFPPFDSQESHKAIARLTFDRTVACGLLDAESPISSPVISDIDADDFLGAKGRTSTWGTFRTNSYSSACSSDYGDDDDLPEDSPNDTPAWTPGTPLSPACSSDAGSDCDEEDFEDEDEDKEEDDDEPPQLRDFLQKIRVHIYKSMHLISLVEPGDLIPRGRRASFDAVLIKCQLVLPTEGVMSKHAKEGMALIRSAMLDDEMRWDKKRFRRFETIPFSGHHDGAFEPRYVGELSEILRGCLADVH